MKRIIVGMSLVVAAFSVTSADNPVTRKSPATSVDTVCADNHATEPGTPPTMTRSATGCIKSGFSLITADRKVLKFDTKGNEQALALIKATDKDKEWKVVVTGKLDGQTMAVRSIALE